MMRRKIRMNKKKLKEQKQQLHRELDWEHPLSPEEKFYLLGPGRLPKELLRAFRVFLESARGFIKFRRITNCITIFGSARFNENHKYYKLARRMGQLLAENNFSVMTGGGPGIMEAANRGAKDKGGRTIGCNIKIRHEQYPNAYLDKWITFNYFFVRKVMLTKHSRGFIVMPGGFGTLDELFEMATLIQTEKIENFPVVLMGIDYWQPLLDFLQNTLAKEGTIDQDDVVKIKLTDSPEEAINFIRDYQ